MVAELPAGVTRFDELYVAGKRQIKARWPNKVGDGVNRYPKGYAKGDFSGKADSGTGVKVRVFLLAIVCLCWERKRDKLIKHQKTTFHSNRIQF